jgi:dipeptidyl aminopeptidase/acylaminoacyl peptidase
VPLRQIKQPVLIMQGELDMQVTHEQADTIAAVLRSSGNSNVTLKKFPMTNHLFVTDASGMPQGYGSLTNTHVRKDVLGALADWAVLQATGAVRR